MSKAQSLQTLIDLTQTETDAAAVRLGCAQAEVSEAESRLTLLLRYRGEYQVRFRDAVTRGISSAGWRNFHEFMDKLEAAIEQQREAVTQARQVEQGARNEWNERNRKLMAYDTLVQREAQVAARQRARVEQREQDEFAAKSHAQRKLQPGKS
ncbi:MAG TPA: flagellar export protein FliJ [Burkholderiales bacterium]|nr:flagellar export protein FliJ [Burkholderiales bacterium]